MATSNSPLSIDAARALQVTLDSAVTPPATGSLPFLPSPDFEFIDDYSGAKDSRWSNKNVEFGGQDPTNPENKVAIAKYWPEGRQAPASGQEHAWSESVFILPVNAVQIEMGFRQFVPASYTNANVGNCKLVGFHSGPYGVINSNVNVATEVWPVAGGGEASLYTGSYARNYGQLRPANASPVWLNGEGKWSNIHVLLELAKDSSSFGRYRLWRDDELLVDNATQTMREEVWDGTPPSEIIKFSERGNFITDCRVHGWFNSRLGQAFEGSTEVHFLFDDFYLRANETFKVVG